MVVDRRVRLDLSIPGQFVLEAAVDDPQALGSLTLYFRSGNGWYASGKPLEKKAWQSLTFSKASFGVEGNPAGWGKIDGIRLSVWRPPGTGVADTAVRFRRLAAVSQEVAVVVPEDRSPGRRTRCKDGPGNRRDRSLRCWTNWASAPT